MFGLGDSGWVGLGAWVGPSSEEGSVERFTFLILWYPSFAVIVLGR